MKLEIMSGQPGIVLNDKFTNLLRENSYYVGDLEQKNFMIYPERYIFNQKELYGEIRKQVKKYLEEDEDLFVLTYSDHVLNAVRVEIKKHGFKGGRVHQFTKDGDEVVAHILPDGRLDVWVPDIFDVWEQALSELI